MGGALADTTRTALHIHLAPACPLPAGPGPGRYALPSTLGSVNHDPTKRTNPSYRFGMRLSNASKRGPPRAWDVSYEWFTVSAESLVKLI